MLYAAQDRDDGAWNLAMAGGTCLTLVASVVGQDVIPLVMPFVQVRAAVLCIPGTMQGFLEALTGPPLSQHALGDKGR